MRSNSSQKIQEDSNREQIALGSLKAESDRILEVIKTGDPEKAANNLSFLLDAGLIKNKETSDYLRSFLVSRPISQQLPYLPGSFASIHWPPNEGFAPGRTSVYLEPGELIDRFGDDLGVFFSPLGTLYKARSSPFKCAAENYKLYKVMKPLPALVGPAAPAF